MNRAGGGKPPAEGGRTSPVPSGRDLVVFFSNLVRTLEAAAGSEAFAERLAGLRRDGGKADVSGRDPAYERVFRRLGLIPAGAIFPEAVRELAERTAAAVSRPAGTILALFDLFVRGDPRSGLKAICGSAPDCRLCRLTRECDYHSRPAKPEMARISPAERLLAGDAAALSDDELLGVLLFGGTATGREDAVASLLSRYGRLRAVFGAGAGEYAGIRELAQAQALRLAAVAALHRRLLAERRGERLIIASARDIYDRYAAEAGDADSEAPILLLLDAGNRVIRDIRRGGTEPAELLRPAVREGAARIALASRRPSRREAPSAADADATRRLRGACECLGIGLLDHVIMAEDGYFSFAESGMLET